jgi:hypothetical protein
LIAVFLLPFLTSCATDPQIVTRYVTKPIPESLLGDCEKSELQGNTYQAAIDLAISRGKDLDACNQRIQGIREYNRAAPAQ